MIHITKSRPFIHPRPLPGSLGQVPLYVGTLTIRIYQISKKFFQVSWTYRVFIKYCIFLKDFKIFRTLAFFCFPSVSVCVHTHTRQVENQRCSRTGRVQKNHKILRKKHNIWWTPCILSLALPRCHWPFRKRPANRSKIWLSFLIFLSNNFGKSNFLIKTKSTFIFIFNYRAFIKYCIFWRFLK